MVLIRRIGRHQIGDVAHHKQIARFSPEHRHGVQTAVTARDEHRARALAILHQAGVPGFAVLELHPLPAFEPVDKVGGDGAG